MRISDCSSDVCSSDLLVPVAVAIAQADDLLAIAEHFGRQRRGDDGDVRQAAQFSLQHRVGAQLAIEFDQRHMRDEPRAVEDRKSVVEGKGVSVRVEFGGRRNLKQKKKKERQSK